MTFERRVARIEAVNEIVQLKAHYSELCDQGYDADALCALFLKDAIWDGGELGRFAGRGRIRRFFENMPNVMSMAIHHVTNPSIQVAEDALSGVGKWYLLQAATMKATKKAVWLSGAYEDQFRCVDGRWYFANVKIRTRFFTPYESGWAEVPFVDIAR